MSLISVSQVQDGVTSVNASSVNTPINTIVNDYNGNITDANISASAAIAFSKISGGSATGLAAWASWVPTWTNLSVGNGTLVAKYVQTGKTVHLRIHLTLGSTSTVGSNPYFSLPMNWASDYVVRTPIGLAHFEDTGNAGYEGAVIANSLANNTGLIVVNAAGATYVQGTSVTASIPFAFGTGDQILLQATYEGT